MIMIFVLLGVVAILLLSNPSLLGGSVNVPSSISQWQSLADKYALQSSLNANEILAIIWNESSGNPNASNPSDPSWGLMGVNHLIGTSYGDGIGTDTDLFDPEINIAAGSGFLADLKNKYSATFPLGSATGGWVQMYNIGETKFLQGVRMQSYEDNFQAHLNALGG